MAQRINYQLEEEIWGFRFYEATAMVVLLEFLFVACRAGLCAARTDELKTPKFNAPSHIFLRCLLFNNPMLETAADWAEWEAAFKSKVTDQIAAFKDWNAEYLKKSFPRFSDFQMAVRLVQAAAVRPAGESRRWTNKFLFPWDQEQIFPDVKFDKDKAEDAVHLARNHFGHAGELVYLLLCLFSKKSELQEWIDRRFKGGKHVMSRLCAALEGQWADRGNLSLEER